MTIAMSTDDLSKIDDETSQQLISGGYESLFRTTKAKLMARQQLAISDDSPFNIEKSDTQDQQRRADLIEKETYEIRKQLDYVKDRLSSLRLNEQETTDDQTSGSTSTENHRIVKSNSSCSISKPGLSCDEPSDPRKSETKFRPLTGKSDCPNCRCDRRSSICDECAIKSRGPSIIHTSVVAQENQQSKSLSNKTGSQNFLNNYDERPIRPMKEPFKATVEAINDVVVPGKVYNISRSLNDKRTKLAKAIDDLKLMIDKVKARGERLEQERKVVQLYKDQWKYGPKMGGTASTGRDKLGSSNIKQSRNYESRLDANLARDSKSLMGFQDIESTLKLRQYGPIKRISPIRSRMPNKLREASSSTVQTRSKSLESLKPTAAKTINIEKSNKNFDHGKSSSEINLSTKIASNGSTENKEDCNDDDDIEVYVVGDEDEEALKGTNNKSQPQKEVKQINQPDNGFTNKQQNVYQPKDADEHGKVQKMTWIPVFGETEIKTAKRIVPRQRKVTIVESSGIQSGKNKVDRSRLDMSTRNQISIKNRQQSQRSSSTGRYAIKDRTLTEAQRQLRTASDLLEKEKTDSKTKNQLIINRTIQMKRNPSIKQQLVANDQQQDSLVQVKISNHSGDVQTVNGNETSKELARLEAMMNQQQEMLSRLVELQRDRPVASPISVSYSGTCHSTGIPPVRLSTARVRALSPSPIRSSSLSAVNHLRDKLNKTKLRLTRTLEQEREKHQKLKMEVDSSMRKQLNLESENKLLKQSLNQCIDTCLRDIMSTFESLNESLTNQTSVDDKALSNDTNVKIVDEASDLNHAAKLISEKRHLRQMKSHIESIERQRKGMFEELGKEKNRSKELEAKLAENKAELDRLVEAKRLLERQLEEDKQTIVDNTRIEGQDKPIHSELSNGIHSSKLLESESVMHTIQGQTTSEPLSKLDAQERLDPMTNQDDDMSEKEDTYSSIDTYRRFINSISPDIDWFRQQRRPLFEELDELKRMLSEFNVNDRNK